MSKIEYKDIMAFHPGYYIKEIIEDMEMTQCEFAKRLDTTDKTLSKLLSGQISLSLEIAKKLSQMLGTSVDMWLNLQKKYNEKYCEIEQMKELDKEVECLNCIKYKYFSDLNVVPSTRDKKEQVKNLRKYLCVSELSVLSRPDLLAACRTAVSEVELKNVINANAWIQTGINFAKGENCSLFSKKKLEGFLPEIRGMTIQNPIEFYGRLKKIFSECGVAFVVLPYLTNSGINGAVKWLSNDKVMLLMNDRRKYADTFWFALFHEIKHILQEMKKDVYISIDDTRKNLTLGLNDEKSESEADLFACEYLIPGEKYQRFLLDEDYTSTDAVKKFAESIGVHPSIVVGRLQHDKKIAWNSSLVELKIKYVIS